MKAGTQGGRESGKRVREERGDKKVGVAVGDRERGSKGGAVRKEGERELKAWSE